MNQRAFTIRNAKLDDLIPIQELFVNTIRGICHQDYSPQQIDVWTSSVANKQRWIDKLNSQFFLVAEINNEIVGFASLESNDYLDFLYVHKDHQRKGIARHLYAEIENEALKRKSTGLSSDVSETAKPFFEMHGFNMIVPQNLEINGVIIRNYKMFKQF